MSNCSKDSSQSTSCGLELKQEVYLIEKNSEKTVRKEEIRKTSQQRNPLCSLCLFPIIKTEQSQFFLFSVFLKPDSYLATSKFPVIIMKFCKFLQFFFFSALLVKLCYKFSFMHGLMFTKPLSSVFYINNQYINFLCLYSPYNLVIFILIKSYFLSFIYIKRWFI